MSSTALVLRVMAFVLAFLFLIVGIMRVLGRNSILSTWGAAEFGELGLIILLGLASGGLLLGVSAMLRVLRGLHASMVRIEQHQDEVRIPIGSSEDATAAIASSTSVSAAPDAESAPPMVQPEYQGQNLLIALDDIRDSLLLSPEERLDKRRRLVEEEIHNARVLVSSLTKKGDFGQAREVAESVRRKYPGEVWATELVEQVEESREQHESEDVSSVTHQVNDLMSISAWERANHLARQLVESHPDSAEARQLWLRVERQHRQFLGEQQRRMNAEIQRFVSARRWEEALAAARIFVQRFPNSADSEALRMQIPTLEANAEIEVRQRIEAQIMACARQGRYMEAAELAKSIVQRYPDSPQAQVLRSQLGRLEELAQNPEASSGRIRLDEQ
ncbi:MAG: tetratricopeptide repeat protein [Planctomycetota bacterium]